MGSFVSKAARITSSPTAARRYPTKFRDLPHAKLDPSDVSRIGDAHGVGPKVYPSPTVSGERTNAINADAADPDFQSMLHTVGVVDPSAAMSRHTPISQNQLNKNPAVRVLSQRSSISAKQREEFENPGVKGQRNWVDTGTIRKIIQLRDEMGWDAMRIEKELGLANGLVERLGSRVAAP